MEDYDAYAFIEFPKINEILLIQPSLSLEPILYQALSELRRDCDFSSSFRGKSYPSAQQYILDLGIIANKETKLTLARRCVRKILEAFYMNGYVYVASTCTQISNETLIFRRVTHQRRNWTPHIACLVFDKHDQIKILDGQQSNFHLAAITSALKACFLESWGNANESLWKQTEEGDYLKINIREPSSLFDCDKKTLLFTQSLLSRLSSKGWRVLAHFNGKENTLTDTLYFVYQESITTMSEFVDEFEASFANVLLSNETKISIGFEPGFQMISDSSYTFSMSDGEDYNIRDVLLPSHSSKPSDLWTVHSWTVVEQWCKFLQRLSQSKWTFCQDIRFGSGRNCKKTLVFSKNPNNVSKQFACVIFAPKEDELFFVNFQSQRGILDFLVYISPFFEWSAKAKPAPVNVQKVVIEGSSMSASKKQQTIKFCQFMLKLMHWLHQERWILEMTDNSSCLNGWFFSKSTETSTVEGATDFPIPSAPALPQYDPFAPPSYEEATKMTKQ